MRSTDNETVTYIVNYLNSPKKCEIKYFQQDFTA